MSEIQANCPHCGTSFSVALAQLSVANGHVRCGVCMKVFKAGEVPAEEETFIAEEPVAKQSPTPISALDDDASIEAWIKKNQKTGNANIQSGPVSAPEGDIPMESLRFDDEISDLFEDLKPAAKPGSKDFTAVPDDDISIPAYAAKNDVDDDTDRLVGNFSDSTNKKPAPKPKRGNRQQNFETNENSDDPFANDGFADDFDDPFAIDHDDEPLVHVVLGSTEIEEVPTLESRLNGKKLWPSLSAVFSILLICQLLINNFDELAIDPSYRGFYSVFCSVGICELPALKNVNSIRASNLIVRPHPKRQGALIVDAIINNKAPFAQDFPNLLLSFSNIQGTVIASREFKPSEYLQGELKGLEIMPSQSPLHLSMEVVDPGKEALSYQLDFVSGS